MSVCLSYDFICNTSYVWGDAKNCTTPPSMGGPTLLYLVVCIYITLRCILLHPYRESVYVLNYYYKCLLCLTSVNGDVCDHLVLVYNLHYVNKSIHI